MSEIYDLNIAITLLVNTLGELIEELNLQGLRDSIHDLTDAMEEQKKAEQLRDFNIVEEHLPLTNKSYEATLLGGLMLDHSKFDLVLERVTASAFKDQRHCNIFNAMKRLHKKGKPLDTLSILEEFKHYAPAEKYLFDLAKETSSKVIPHLPTIANVVMVNSHQREKK